MLCPRRIRAPKWSNLERFCRHFSIACLLLATTSKGQNQVIVQIGQNFTGTTYGVGSSSNPPDSDGAAGPNHFVEFINGRFSVYNKTTGAQAETSTDLTFWSLAGVTITSGWKVSDPRIVYDSSAQRWFAAEVDYDPSGSVNANHFLLAVSATADPTGVWKGVSFASDNANNFADFPTLGLDAQGVYLSANMFDTLGNSIRPNLVSIPKSGLLASTPSAASRTLFTSLSYN